jgi:hypothetical protein
VCHLGGIFVPQSRRGFLIGVGAVLTTAFVKDARSFIHRNNELVVKKASKLLSVSHFSSIAAILRLQAFAI